MHYFTDHPQSVNETYAQHLCYALRTSVRLASYSIVCIIHGILPCIFTTYVSDHVEDLYDEMHQRREKLMES